MTIIKPSGHQGYIQFLLFLFVSILIGGAVYISQYNSFVDARHELRELKKNIIDLQSANADLKNDLYGAVDLTKLEKLAEDDGLKLDKNPEYLNNDQWLSDSSY